MWKKKIVFIQENTLTEVHHLKELQNNKKALCISAQQSKILGFKYNAAKCQKHGESFRIFPK